MSDDGVLVHLTEREAWALRHGLSVAVNAAFAAGRPETADAYGGLYETVTAAHEDALAGDVEADDA